GGSQALGHALRERLTDERLTGHERAARDLAQRCGLGPARNRPLLVVELRDGHQEPPARAPGSGGYLVGERVVQLIRGWRSRLGSIGVVRRKPERLAHGTDAVSMARLVDPAAELIGGD